MTYRPTGYRVQTGRPIERKGPEDLPGIEGKVRERDDGFALAMVFDPGEHVEAAENR